ncbi:MAG TPA: hypothetical protein VFA41_09320 [Ktedonobacteraceae bacterium]|jgi:hypothetical protein|nr:hypothetical protein [Ktedonobacteraceae bacterium]
MNQYSSEKSCEITLTTLAVLSSEELKQYHNRTLSNEQYCIELLRRALYEQKDDAWLAIEQCFGRFVRSWFWNHRYRDVALQRDSEENYLAQTFSRFWYAVREQQIEFTSLAAILAYLHATLNGVLADTMRVCLRRQAREMPWLELNDTEELAIEDPVDSQAVWEAIQRFLPDERERRLAYLLYYCGLKPRDIVRHCPQEFDDVKEVYRLSQNILDRLRRNRERLRLILDLHIL